MIAFFIRICRSKKINFAKDASENNIDCTFGELGLLEVLSKKKNFYRKNIPSAATLNPLVVFAVIVDNAHGRRELNLNEPLLVPRNIGRVFNLDSVTMLECLYEIEKLGLVKINHTAGLDPVNILQDVKPLTVPTKNCPAVPSSVELLDYQQDAVDEWARKNYR